MSKLKDVGLIRALLLVGALAAANALVAWTSRPLEAQGSCFGGGVCEGDNQKCSSQMPLPGSFCDYYPGFSCSIATCEETALEP